jgi:hypothetical protein
MFNSAVDKIDFNIIDFDWIEFDRIDLYLDIIIDFDCCQFMLFR